MHEWVAAQAPGNIAVLDQAHCALRTMMQDFGLSPATQREAQLFTLGAILMTSNLLCNHDSIESVDISTFTTLEEVRLFCAEQVGADYLDAWAE